MTLSISSTAIRPLTTLLAALVLASSGAIALAATADAAKPVPSVGISSASCLNVAGIKEYTAFFNLSGNKGRWVHAVVELRVGNGDYQLIEDGRFETDELHVDEPFADESESSTWRLTFTNNKGVPIENAEVTEASADAC